MYNNQPYGQPPPGQYGQQQAPGGYGQQQQAPHGYGQGAAYGHHPPAGHHAPAGHHTPAGHHPPGGHHGGHHVPPQQQGYNYGQPPAQTYGQTPQGYGGGYGAPAAAGPPPGVNPELWNWFQAVDQDRSGKITWKELQQALHNGNWTPFNEETCRLMIGMFDRDRNGTIDITEFAALWKYIQDWKNCFDGFDRDRSGSIDHGELTHALRTFGYNLSTQFVNLCVKVFDRSGRNQMRFDDFIQCCVMLKTLTDKFRTKDLNQSGSITINYEEFLVMVLDTTLTGK